MSDPGATPALTDLLTSLGGREGRSTLVDTAIASAREHLGMDLSLLSEFRDGRQVYRRFSGPAESFGVERDGGPPLEATYCHRVVSGALDPVVPDSARHPVVAELPITREAGIGAYVGVPVHLPDGQLYGTLCCLSHAPDPSLRDRDARFLEVLATILGEEIGRDQERIERHRTLAERVRSVLGNGSLSSVFQPIVALRDGRLAGLEALVRVDAAAYRSPEPLFADAREVGLGAEVELAAVAQALAHLDRLPADVYLSVNLSPATVASPLLDAVLDGVDARRVLIEVTEHAVADEYEVLRSAMGGLRELGSQFAIDDVGAGYAGLNHLLQLAPDVIKLDRFLIRGIAEDPARQAIAAAAAAFAAHARTRVIAEGVETAADHERLLELGIRYGQGFHYGRAGTLEQALATG